MAEQTARLTRFGKATATSREVTTETSKAAAAVKAVAAKFAKQARAEHAEDKQASSWRATNTQSAGIKTTANTKSAAASSDVYNQPGVYEVDRIIAVRGPDHEREYKVRWVGYDRTTDTWEKASQFCDPSLVTEFEAEQARKLAARTASAPPKRDAVDHDGCCLHTVHCTLSSSLFGGNGPVPHRHLEQHPYLFGTVTGRLCGTCANRVRFTREATRVLNLGGTFRNSIGEHATASALPANASAVKVVDQLRSSQPWIMSNSAAAADKSEEVCGVCMQVLEDDTQTTRCAGELEDGPCSLAYHLECLNRVGGAKFASSTASNGCPYCQNSTCLTYEERKRM
jgi:hypothetical protein